MFQINYGNLYMYRRYTHPLSDSSKLQQLSDKLTFDDLVIPIVLDHKSTCMEDIANAGILHQSFLEWPQLDESFWTHGLDDKMTLFWDKLITKLRSGGNLKRKS